MGKYRVVVERSERISYLIDADTAEDAEVRYLGDGEEDWGKTLGTNVVSIEQEDVERGVQGCPCCGDTEYSDPAQCTVCHSRGHAHPDPLVEELRASDPKEFGRPAVPSVYAEYAALKDAAPNGMVYDAEAKAYFTERHEIPEDLLKHLVHEIYLASGQYRLARMVADEQAARAEGWVAITEIEPADGMLLDVRSAVMPHSPYRLKPTGQPGAPWALLSKGKRTRGVNHRRLVEQHQAFLRAKERGQVEMDGPAVVMVRIVKKGN